MPNANKTTMTRVTLIILILTTLATFATGQNLVPNPSFEIYNSCPGPYWPNDINQATPWYNPNTASPDYFDTCATAVSAGIGVPNNVFGHQYPRTGTAYAGLYTFGYNGSNCRDYVQVKLLDTLKATKQYCVTFYLSLCINNSCSLALTKMGLLFSNNPITSNNYSYFNYTPQITSPTGTYLTDTSGWIQVSGTYTATGGETYITIGNFNTDANTDTLDYGTTGGSKQAYYFLDDISVIDCATIGLNELKIKNSFSIYPNPTSDQSTLQFDNTKTELCTLTLYNNCGQIVRTVNNITSDKVVIQKNNLTNGLYYFVLRTSDRVIVTGKLAVD